MNMENGDQVTKRVYLCPQDSRGGGNYPQDSKGGGSNPNNPPYLRHCLKVNHHLAMVFKSVKDKS